MELDKRIKEGKRPLTCFDTEEAKAFIGKECYFSNDMSRFGDLNCSVEKKEIKKAELTHVSNTDPCYEIPGFYYDFCLPCEWVKEPEKKYRPYSLNEFLNEHEIGDKITYRTCRFNESTEQQFIRHKAMICGYQIMEGEANTPGKGFINLGGFWVSLQVMFDDYETPNSYLYPEVWQPFGVIEND